MKEDGLDAFRIQELQKRISELQLDVRTLRKAVASKAKALQHLGHSWAVRHGILQAKYDVLLEENKKLKADSLGIDYE